MVRVKLSGVHVVSAKLADGSRVRYHAIRGVKGSRFWIEPKDGPVGSPEYVRAYENAKRPIRTTDTFECIITAYKESGEFRQLSARTKKDYGRWLDAIRDKFGKAPRESFNRPAIRQVALAWRDQWTGRNAQYAWTVLRLIVGWAYDRGMVQQHHLRGGKRLYSSDRAAVIWLEAEVAAMEEGAPAWLSRALRGAVETGLRPGDLVKLTKANVQNTPLGRRVVIRTSKRQRPVAIPVTSPMACIIDSAEMLLFPNEHGLPLSPGWLSKALVKWKRKLNLRDDLRLYDARGSACTRLMLAGLTIPEIALLMGWSVKTAASMLETYAALDPAMTDSALVKLESVKRSVKRAADKPADGG